ncbi:MAG TPA: hypothetical protein DCP98_05025 [Sphaerochaeta sp.]|nr:hypothetical protein [Sphaerochaeta sp.]
MCENYNGTCFLLHHCRGDRESCPRFADLSPFGTSDIGLQNHGSRRETESGKEVPNHDCMIE